MRPVGILGLAALAATSPAQLMTTTFVKSGTQTDVVLSEGAALPNGNFAFGICKSGGSSLYVLSKVGGVIAGKVLQVGTAATRFRTMSVDTLGNIYAIGDTMSTPSTRVISIHKFTQAGAPIWSRTLDPGTGTYESVRESVCDKSGNLLFIGHSGSNPNPSGSEVAWVVRLRPNGTVSFDTDLNGVLTYGRTLCVADNGSIHASSYTNFQSYYWRLNGVTGLVEHTDDLPASSFCESMIASGNRVFLAGVGIPPTLTERPMVLANNVLTGNTEWSTFVTSSTVSGGIFQKVALDGAGTPIAAGEMVDGAEVGMVTKFNPANGAIVWHRKVGNSSQQRTYAGFEIDKWNESYISTRLLDSPDSFVRIDVLGPTGSVRGGLTFPTTTPADTVPGNLIYQPTHGRGVSLGVFGGTARNSRWIGFERQPIAITDSYSVVRNGTLNSPNSVNANDRYWDRAVTALHAAPSHGALIFRTDGTFTYTPDSMFTGPDNFQYRLTRTGMPPSIGTVNINVTP